jgi:hypothetical protein
MFPSRILFAAAALVASGVAVAQATPPAVPSAAPAAAPKASQAPATPAAPATAPNSQRAPGKASATSGTGAAPSGGSASGKAPKSANGEPRRQLQSLYASVMTAEEKDAYGKKVREVKTYDQCKALLEETNKAMEPRAKAQGTTIAQTPTEACDKAKARGRVKG